MGNPLEFMSANGSALFATLLFMVGLLILTQWLFWVAGWGRFSAEARSKRGDEPNRSPIRHVIADLFVKVIDDFRHLLALIIVIMFAMTLVYALYIAGTNVDNITKALQAVTGTLSGVIGVIIGYYFGESAARRAARDTDGAPPAAGGEPVARGLPPGDPAAGQPAGSGQTRGRGGRGGAIVSAPPPKGG